MSDTTIAFALLLLRAVLGLVFLLHGVKHFRNRESTIRWTASIGFKNPTMQWFFMSFTEIGIGIGLLLGFLTAFAAAGVVAMMAVAFWTVHRHAGFFVTARPDEGYEYVLVLSVLALVVAVLGPGTWSLDDVLGILGTFDGRTGGLIASAGVAGAAVHLGALYRPS